MALMCEVCKCTIGKDTGCDNGCQCCNNPEFVSDSDLLARAIAKLQDDLIFAKRNEYHFDLAEYASNDRENTYARHYWQGQIDAIEQTLKSLGVESNA